MTRPLFSVIIPLEYHRGQWEKCWKGWQTQTLPKSQYEVILVVPPDFPEHDKLPTQLGPQDRLEYSTERHDIGLCAAGAARARGHFLFFTESHCWPEPDVLEKCQQAFTTHPEWAAFSCQSLPITHNRLSIAEADMYEDDIRYALTIHPWRKVLDQCFVTRCDSYKKSGGLKSEFGHFAEWVLGAKYFELGYPIGFLPDAHLHHYYIGDIDELCIFSRDFITGEMRYFAHEARDSLDHLFELPPEWICQGNWDHRLARKLLRIAMHDILVVSARRLRQPLLLIRNPIRWLMAAIAGEDPALIQAAVKVGLARAVLRLSILVGSSTSISAAFKTYIATLIHHQRLACLKPRRDTKAQIASTSRADSNAAWDIFAPGNAGFYPIETYQETRFRWSEPAAIMPAWVPEGRHRVCMECLPTRSLARASLRFYVNERLLPAQDVSIGPDTIELTFYLPQSGPCTLGWTCLRFHAKNDSRWLGLPIKRTVWKLDPQPSPLIDSRKPES
jgi:hypothetical protein